MRRLSRRTVFRSFVVVTLVVMVPAIGAQNPTGSIRGTVVDERGAVIQSAAVTITNRATGDARRLTTGADGSYVADNLLPGVYEVRVEAPGFTTSVQTVTVQVGGTSSGDCMLRVGSPSEVVEVVGEAPLIDRTSYKIDGVITRQKIDALPLNGRNFLQLAMLEPGVTVSVSNPGAANNLFNVSVAGAPAERTRITVDGGSVTDQVTGGAGQNFSTETIQEFQISTFNFDLSTGYTGVGAVNIISRTGTNEFHGTAFYYYRDHNIAAFPTLRRSAFNPDPFFRRAQYGGSLGGPIKRDRAFFFGNVEWLNQNSAISTIHTGFPVFSQFDTITASTYDAVVWNVRGDVRLTDRNTMFLRFSGDDNDAYAPDGTNQMPSVWRVNRNRDYNVQGALTTLLGSNLINDLRFNFHRIGNNSDTPTARECPPSLPTCLGLGGAQVQVLGTNFVIGNSSNAPQWRRLYRYQTNENISWLKGNHRFRFGAEWEHQYGKGAWAFAEPAVIVLHDPRNVLLVNAQVAQAPLPDPAKQALTIPLPAAFTRPGVPLTLADILQLPIAVAFVGIGDPSQPPPFNVGKARRNNRFRFYGQDSWTLGRGFTLSYGVAYQFETTLYNHDLPKPALIRPLIGSLNPTNKDKNNIAPALGFAWDIGNKGKTVIRGGAGIFYDTNILFRRLQERANIGPLGNGRVLVSGAFFQNPLQFPQIPGLPAPLNQINPPVGAPINFTTIPTKFTGKNFLDLLAAQTPVIQARLQALGSAGLTGIDFFKTGNDIYDPIIPVEYTEHYTLGVQRQLPHNMALSADFVWRHWLHLEMQNDRNLFNRVGGPIIPRCVGAQAADPRVLCSNGPISIRQNSGRRTYKALLVKLDKRFSRRYLFTASYALQDQTTFFTSEDLTNWFRHHGPISARQSLVVSAVVDLPRGFQLSVITAHGSPGPFNARIPSNIDLNGDGTRGDTLPGLRINTLGYGTSKPDLARLVSEFNQNFAGKRDAAGATIPFLVLPGQFEFGDSFHTTDVRVSKSFRLAERVSLQVMAEVFNLFNIANLGGFSGALDFTANPSQPPASFSFGQPTLRAGQNFGQGGPRAFQFAARLSF